MKILVTGANGHVGYNLSKALIEAAHRVRASIRSASDRAKAEAVRALGPVELVGLDVQREDEFARAAEGLDLMFRVAATYAYYTGSKAKDDLAVPYFKAKTEAERRAWQLAEELGVKLVTILPGGIGGPGFLRPTPTIDVFDGRSPGAPP